MRTLILACLLAGCSQTDSTSPDTPKKKSSAKGEEIVFITPSRTGTEIRAMRPDGTKTRQIFEIPDYAVGNTVIWDVNASPDGSQIAFSSNHDWDRSYNTVNVYVIDADGKNLKRPSDAPSIPELRKYKKKGKVKLNAQKLVGGGEISAWVQGANEPVKNLLREGQVWQFTVEAKDFGDDIPQFIRVFNHNPGHANECSYDPALRADIRPGKTIDAGKMPMLFPHTCPKAYSPGWIDNDTLVVMFAEPDTTVSPHNVWTVDVDIQPNEVGARWYDTRGEVSSSSITQVFAGGAEGDEPTVVFFRSQALATWIAAAPANDPANIKGGHVRLCDEMTTCKLTGLDVTPDGETTILSVYASGTRQADYSAIFISHNDGEFKPVLKLQGEAIGTVAISPDGQQIVFDRARRLRDTYQRVRYGERIQCPCSIWRVNVDGTEMTQIAEDGRFPDWSR